MLGLGKVCRKYIMKIEYDDGTVADSDRMDDFSAELAEKNEEVKQWFANKGIAFSLRFNNPVKNKCGGCYYPKSKEEWEVILGCMVSDLEKFTGKKVVLVERED